MTMQVAFGLQIAIAYRHSGVAVGPECQVSIEIAHVAYGECYIQVKCMPVLVHIDCSLDESVKQEVNRYNVRDVESSKGEYRLCSERICRDTPHCIGIPNRKVCAYRLRGRAPYPRSEIQLAGHGG